MLMNTILNGWLSVKQDCPQHFLSFWQVRDELSVAEGLIMRGSRIVVPQSLRMDMLVKFHESHLGMEKCKRSARVSLYWPGMNAAVTDMTISCSKCI